MLTYDEQKEAVNLAMQIETGTIDYLEVCKNLAKNRQKALGIVSFWFSFNAMTQNALNLLCYFKKRYDLEKCFKLEASPSRGTNAVRDEHASTETVSFRRKCERCRFMRGRKSTSRPRSEHHRSDNYGK